MIILEFPWHDFSLFVLCDIFLNFFFNFSDKSKPQKLKDSKRVRDSAPNKGSIAYGFVQNLRLEGHHKAAFVVDEIRKNPGELGPRLAAFLKQENQPENGQFWMCWQIFLTET